MRYDPPLPRRFANQGHSGQLNTVNATTILTRPIDHNHHHDYQTMLPIQQAESYASIETQIQATIEVLE
jgi:hypothetical protein